MRMFIFIILILITYTHFSVAASNDVCKKTLVVDTSDPLKLLTVQLTFANDGGLLNTAATWMGSDEEFRNHIKTLAGKNEVLAEISEVGSSMARFIDVSVVGSEEKLTNFVKAFYDQFYGGYGLASEKERFVTSALSQAKDGGSGRN